MNTLKIAYIGMGYRGKQLLALTRHIPYFQVTAIADPEARDICSDYCGWCKGNCIRRLFLLLGG